MYVARLSSNVCFFAAGASAGFLARGFADIKIAAVAPAYKPCAIDGLLFCPLLLPCQAVGSQRLLLAIGLAFGIRLPLPPLHICLPCLREAFAK
jgi:NADH:ubiquinone oxidoreductase subunit 4 (subunit M)